jgi:hypothetical protein
LPVAADQIDEFVDAALAAFERAWDGAKRTGQTHELSLTLARRAIRLRIAGARMAARFVPALAHALSVESSAMPASDLVISCWDRSEAGEPPPPPPWSFDDMLPRGRVRGHTQDRVRVAYDTWMRMLCVYDRERATALVHIADIDEIPHWIDRSPLRSVLTWWAADRELAFLHASAVALGDAAVAIAGASGSGKSTTALACYSAGFDFIGDDACIADVGAEPALYPVYGVAKLELDALDRLPSLRSQARAVASDSSQHLLEPGDRLRTRASFRAMVLPEIVDQDHSELVEVTGREALRVLVPSSLLEGMGAGGSSLHALTRLVDAVPVFRLACGRDLDGVVRCVRRALEP